MHYSLLIYFNNKPLYVSSSLAAHHQENRLYQQRMTISATGIVMRYVEWLLAGSGWKQNIKFVKMQV